MVSLSAFNVPILTTVSRSYSSLRLASSPPQPFGISMPERSSLLLPLSNHPPH